MSDSIYLNGQSVEGVLLNVFVTETLDGYLGRAFVYLHKAISAQDAQHAKFCIQKEYRSVSGAFSGVITEIKLIKEHYYEFIIESPLALLKDTKHSRIFKDQSVITILESVLSSYRSLKIDMSRIHRQHSPLAYIVQYQESDAQFIKRLMVEQGLFYFFRTDTMILCDDIAGYDVYDQPQRVPMMWRRVSQFVPDQLQLHGKLTQAASTNTSQHRLIQHYYPCLSETVNTQEHELRLAVSRIDVEKEMVFMYSDYFGLHVGGVFSNNGYYVVKEIYHQFTQNNGTLDYTNQCYAVPADQMMCLSSCPRPIISHPMLARVVGIESSSLGRVSLRFPWDENKQVTPFISVRQYWANHHYGAQFLPNMGDSVLVDFIDGDIHKPIVVGYNAPICDGIKIGDTRNFMAISTRGIFFNCTGDFSLRSQKTIRLQSQHNIAIQVDELLAKQLKLSASASFLLQVGSSCLELSDGVCRISADKIELNPEK